MNRIISILIIAVCTLAGSGCGTVAAHNGRQPAEPYSGVRHWPTLAKECFTEPVMPCPVWPIAFPVVLADLPFEVAFDTILLPTDAIGCLSTNRIRFAQVHFRDSI